MKKQFGWFVLPGILCAAIFRDRGPGYIMAVVYGMIIGVPLYLLINPILQIFFGYSKEKLTKIIATFVISAVIFLIFWLTYYPPAPILFKRLIADLIPTSVSNLKSASSIDGPSDCSHYLKFNINADDLHEIIKNKELIPVSITVKQHNKILKYELTRSEDTVFSISIDISWFMLSSFENAEAFIMDREDYFREYIFYDPNAEEALYLHFN